MAARRTLALAASLVLPFVAVGGSAQAAPTVDRLTTTFASGGFSDEGVSGDLSLSSTSLYLQYDEDLGGGCRRSVAAYGEDVDRAVAGRVSVAATSASLPATEVPVFVSVTCYDDGGDYIPGSGRDETVLGTVDVQVTATGAPATRQRASQGSIPRSVVYGGTVSYADAVGRVSLTAGALSFERTTSYATLGSVKQVVVQF